MGENDAYDRLISLLDENGARYRLIDHEPEGRTELVSKMRGNPPAKAAKCIVVMVKVGKKVTKYVLAVVPGDTPVDLAAIKSLLGGSYAAFASREVAEQLSGAVTGAVLPFAFNPDLELIADPGLNEHDELFFNAGRLDRSVALNTRDYVAIARPRFASIARR